MGAINLRSRWLAGSHIVLAAVLTTGGCSFDSSGPAFFDGSVPRADARVIDGASIGDARVIDGRVIDAPVDPPDAGGDCDWTYKPVFVDPCDVAAPLPGGDLNLTAMGTYVYNTDDATLSDPQGVVTTPVNSLVSGARAIWVNNLTISDDTTLRAEGSLPLLIVATGNATINGTLAANTFRDAKSGELVLGAGANPAACPASPPDPGQTCAQHGGSGGGAGAFGGDGGNGGEGGDTHDCGAGNPSGLPGGMGGVALVTPPTDLRGGCAGRDGAQNNSGTDERGLGAAGGGAIHVSVSGVLLVAGTIHAGGGGGGGGLGSRSGGGGGGSGGLIGLEALNLQLTSTAIVAANGGGGGGGCDGGVGQPGEDGQPDDQVADGGAKNGAGSDGGGGGAKASPGGQSATVSSRGGGGGGGGVGYVMFYSPQTPTVDGNAKVSPEALVF